MGRFARALLYVDGQREAQGEIRWRAAREGVACARAEGLGVGTSDGGEAGGGKSWTSTSGNWSSRPSCETNFVSTTQGY